MLGDGAFRDLPLAGVWELRISAFSARLPRPIFYYVGSASAPGHAFAPSHSSEFTIDETCISVGMRMQRRHGARRAGTIGKIK